MTSAGPSTVTATAESDAGPAAECSDGGGCDEGHCIIFSDAPADEGAYCDGLPGNGNTRATGTVRSISTQVTASGANVSIVSALQALTNPTGATEILGDTTDGAGEFDTTSSEAIASQIGVIAMAQLDGFSLTGTTTAAPGEDGQYPPSNDVHDIWLVNDADLDQWNGLMESDAAASPYLPMGAEGGMVGLVRSPDGAPLSGVTVTPLRPDSTAVIRYIAPGDVTDGATTGTGLFVILNPGLAEEFSVQGPTGSTNLVALSADDAVFTVAPLLPMG